jgi:CRISPR-associated protein Csb2
MSSAIVIEVELLAGRYHAHLWGESQFGMAGPEWPPSPWRLLRAIASAWFSAGPRLSSEPDRDALLETLGGADPPVMWLPKTSFYELRYYQPVRMGGSDRVLHHDFYAVPEGGRFWFRFNASLSAQQRALLDALLWRLRYFGRSESRARLRVVDSETPPARAERVACRNVLPSVANPVYRWVLCAAPDFRASDLWAVRDGASRTGGCPPHLVDVLLARRMPLPHGARWVEYAVPHEILVHEIRPCTKSPETRPDVKVAEIRFRLSRRIPIPLQSLVGVARAFRDAAVARHRTLSGTHSVILTGRHADGRMALGHQHAYYLPRVSKTSCAIDALTVRVPTGRLTQKELEALLGVDHVRVDGSEYLLTVIPEEIVADLTPPTPAIRWVSTTPFLMPSRHRQKRDLACVEEQLRDCAERLCGRRPVVRLGRPWPMLAHQYLDHNVGSGGRRWILTRRLGFFAELMFEEPVSLTVPLGSDTHFGAGQFEPAS